MTAKLERPDVRAHVLRAALQAVDEVGPDRLRVRDIAERAGMSSGHVMYYFGKRDRILVSTLLLSEDELAERLVTELAAAGGPAEAVARLVELYLPGGPGDVRWRLWAQVIARPPQDEETLARIAGFTEAWARELAAIVVRGMGEGVFRPVDDPAGLAIRMCRIMDSLAGDVLLGLPGRGPEWARDQAMRAVHRELLP
ncbi:AcrR family transcriptional regulator [Streptosporangium becharense]|uniref:AcrR family transcriptional regulator n=1 Tax=Streptosporangium becharense TaxID=1816182 RepID=A0A7W9MJK5_9ACTN|nr:TetR family transcriptional regulator [Streptosporangium becharense]MBB2915152.1 AcrR family transcriptional regulator [Streptosporangium becharense]MBB5822776.1 AcrR family transcriptional regulator [Streptosporangium becharense]